MKQVATHLLPVLALALFVACEKKEETPATTPTTEPATQQTTPTPQATTPTLTATSIDVNTIPVSEEFEEEAAKEITAANLEQKLETLEKEISAE